MEFLAEKKIIIWLIFIVILFHFGKTQEKNVETVKGRTGKAIPIFQVIRFPVEYSMILVTIQIEPLFIIFFFLQNDGCMGGSRNGTCYTA